VLLLDLAPALQYRLRPSGRAWLNKVSIETDSVSTVIARALRCSEDSFVGSSVAKKGVFLKQYFGSHCELCAVRRGGYCSAVLIHNTGWASPRLIPGLSQSLPRLVRHSSDSRFLEVALVSVCLDHIAR